MESDATFTEEVWLFEEIDELGPGQNFGQAVLVANKPHVVTVQCVEDCEVASITREAYVRIVEKAVKRDLQGRI